MIEQGLKINLGKKETACSFYTQPQRGFSRLKFSSSYYTINKDWMQVKQLIIYIHHLYYIDLICYTDVFRLTPIF